MKNVLKWIGIVLGSLIGLLLLVMLGLYAKTRMGFNKTYDLQVETVAIPSDADAIEHGKHLAVVLCAECHGDDFSGQEDFVVVPNLVRVGTPNLTSGKGSVTADFSDADWVRILRHGVKRDGTSVFIMPSMDFQYLSDSDLGDLLAYIKSVPPVDHENPELMHFTFLGNVVYGAGAFGNQLSASRIEQDRSAFSFPEPGVTKEYGEYLVNINGCRACHSPSLAGGQPNDPDSTLAPNLTMGGELVAWTDADFIQTLRTGVALSGHQLNPKFMPWEHKGQMTNDELKAIFLYLQSLPKLPTSTAPADK